MPSGKIEKFPIPKEVYQGARLFLDIDVSLESTGLKDIHRTPAKAFSLLLSGDGVSEISEGFRIGDIMKCPQCDELVGLLIVEGLKNFDQVHVRRKALEYELKQTCPEHRAQWLKAA